MSKIIPMPAFLPPAELAHLVMAPPYDVLTRDEAFEIARDNPRSILHITKSEIDLPPDVDPYGDAIYATAQKNLERFISEKALVAAEPAYYVLRQSMGRATQTGLVGLAPVADYENGLIRKHERTREEKVVDRTRHMLTIAAHDEPVFMVMRANPRFKGMLHSQTALPPLFDVSDSQGVRHTLWRVVITDPFMGLVTAAEPLYIADGHHRSESALRVRDEWRKKNPHHQGAAPCDFFPVVIFPHDEVRVYQYDWSGSAMERPLAKVTIDDIMKLADENGIMPPKSTWFAPKLPSGFFVHGI